MIRLFTKLCKSVLEKLSDEVIFQEATKGFKYHNERCPNCGAAGKLSPYGDYFRNLVYYEGEKIIESRVSTLRFECESCGKTHALLPDILTPYSPYSLRFKLTVLLAYFQRNTTVVTICERFGIAVSTLYEWKKYLLEHKELLLGVIKSYNKPAQTFLRGLIASIRLSDQLSDFFHRYAFSFLQNRSTKTIRYHPP